MKNFFAVFVALVLLITLVGCGNTVKGPNETDVNTSSTTKTEASTSTTSSHTHNYIDATCTEPAKCSCGLTDGSALGHNYSYGSCLRCGEKDSNYKPNADKIGKFYSVYGKEISWNELAEGSECYYYDVNGIKHEYRKLLKNWRLDPDYCYNCGGYLRGTGFSASQTCIHCNLTFTKNNMEDHHNYCGDCGMSMEEKGCYNSFVCRICGEIYKSHTPHTCIEDHPVQY